MTRRDKEQIVRVFNGNLYCVGATSGISQGCSEIYLVDDGHGISGYYDRIHILFEDGRHLIVPAHHCQEFSLAIKGPNQDTDDG